MKNALTSTTSRGIPSNSQTVLFEKGLSFAPLRQRYRASVGSTATPRPIKNLSGRSGLKKGAGG